MYRCNVIQVNLNGIRSPLGNRSLCQKGAKSGTDERRFTRGTHQLLPVLVSRLGILRLSSATASCATTRVRALQFLVILARNGELVEEVPKGFYERAWVSRPNT